VATAAAFKVVSEERIKALQATVSASRLSCFLSCRLKFFFRYVIKIPKAKTAALHLGGAVHSVLRAWNKARWRAAPLSLKQLHEEFTSAWADTSEGEVEWAAEEEEQKKTGWSLVETYIREIPSTLNPDAVEVPVEAELDGLPKAVGILNLMQAGVIID
jgi:putative RecB family exonuclease